MKKHADDEKRRELLRRTGAAGIPVANTTIRERERPPVWVTQNFEDYDSEIFDVNGGTGLVFPLKIVPSIPVFVFSGFHIALDRWKEGWFQPLEEAEDPDWPHYEFY